MGAVKGEHGIGRHDSFLNRHIESGFETAEIIVDSPVGEFGFLVGHIIVHQIDHKVCEPLKIYVGEGCVLSSVVALDYENHSADPSFRAALAFVYLSVLIDFQPVHKAHLVAQVFLYTCRAVCNLEYALRLDGVDGLHRLPVLQFGGLVSLRHKIEFQIIVSASAVHVDCEVDRYTSVCELLEAYSYRLF